MALNEAKIGTRGTILAIDLADDISHHLAHLGFLPGVPIEVLRRSPLGDPRVYRIDGVDVALRNETARHILFAPEAAAR